VTRLVSLLSATFVVASSLVIFAGTAAAHERRMVGPYQLVVGFLSEPAFAGNSNGLDLRVTDSRVTPAKAIEGLQETLTATVQSGGLTPMPLKITARFGTPGAYNGNFVPTAPGAYLFQIKGKIESLDVDEKFESGPGRFNDVESMAALQYPVKVPAANELGSSLATIQSDLTQIRLLAAVAIALGIIAIAAPFVMRRRA
jgi:hypothetical protein